MSSQLRSSIFWRPCRAQEPRWNLRTTAWTQIWTVPAAFLRTSCSVKQLPVSWDWEENRTDSINMATHQQPNRRHIPFEMHRARPGQVNLSFTETRWETCNNNDNTSLTSLLPGLSGTFKIDNLIIYSPPGERERLGACGHVVETDLKARAGPAMEHGTRKAYQSARNTTCNLPGENIFTSSTSANVSDQMFWSGRTDTGERERKEENERKPRR